MNVNAISTYILFQVLLKVFKQNAFAKCRVFAASPQSLDLAVF